MVQAKHLATVLARTAAQMGWKLELPVLIALLLTESWRAKQARLATSAPTRLLLWCSIMSGWARPLSGFTAGYKMQSCTVVGVPQHHAVSCSTAPHLNGARHA